MRNLSLATAVLFAGLFASYFKPQNPPPPDKSTSNQDSAQDDKDKDEKKDREFADHPVQVLLHYLHPRQSIQGEDVVACSSVISTDSIQVRVIFATVVDPDRTRSSLTLDRELDAILKSAQKSGYQFQDLWLPWRLTQDKKETRLEKEVREQLPGLLMFRKSTSELDELLVVWLVGETPTAGISQAQFQEATCFTKMIQGADITGFLGPAFSGTLESLKRGLLDAGFLCNSDLIDSCPYILSGTTTTRSEIEKFKQTFGNFQSMVQDDFYAQEHLRDFLSRQRLFGARVAVLAEGGTLFGNDFAKQVKSSSEKGKSPEEPERPFNQPKPVFHDLINYPREISRLRNAYQSDTKLTASQENAKTPEARRQLLLPLHDSGSGQDVVPNFSSQTPISLETVMFQIAERLRNGRFDVAIITGSNVLDTLFLSRFLAENVPDLRVVIFDSDLLFVHGTDSLDHLGALSVSRYPLLSQFDSTQPLDLFASMSERALFEAAQLLINSDPRANPPLNVPELNSGPLWLSVVGRGAYWPVAMLNSPPATSALEVGAATRVWNTIFWTATLLILYLTSLFFSALRIRVVDGEILPSQLARFHPNPSGESTQATALYQLLSILFIAAAYLAVLCGPVRVYAAGSKVWDWRAQSAAGIVMWLALLAVAAWNVSKWRRNRRIAYLAATGAGLLFAGIGWSLALGSGPDQSGLLRAIRSVNVPSGVAPDVPVVLFLLALAWWSWTNWLRAVFITEREISLNLDDLPRNLYRRLIRMLRMPVVSNMPSGLIVSVVSLLCVVLSYRWLTSIEGKTYDVLIAGLLAANSVALMSTTFGFFTIWSLLRSYLKTLNTYGSQDMDAVAKSVQLPSFWTRGLEDHTFPIARRGLEILKKIRYDRHKYASLVQEIGILEKALDRAAEHVRNGDYISVKETLRIRLTPLRIGIKLRELQPHPKEVGIDLRKLSSLSHVAFIRYVLTQLRNLFSFITVGFLLTACAIHSYPFQGAGYLRWWTGVLFLVPAIAVTLVWYQMEHDPILSKLYGQDEGVDLNSWGRLAAAGALPLLAGISALFPAVGQFLFAWVQPALSKLS